MKYILEKQNDEPSIHIYLKPCALHDTKSNSEYENDEVELLGKDKEGNTWLIASFTNNGKFQPNKNGCKILGIKIDDKFN